MKKKIMTVILALAILCSSLAMYTVAVSAEEEAVQRDSRLRAWFDFNEEHYLGRGNVIFDVFTYEADGEGDAQVTGVYGDDVTVVNGLEGQALKFSGTVSSFNEIANLESKSAFYFYSIGSNLLAGDNVTVNILYKEEAANQMQTIFFTGFDLPNYMAIKTSDVTEAVGPQLSINAGGAFDEQKISVSGEAAPQAGTWNMLTVVQEGTACKIYINGTLVKTEKMNYKLEDIVAELDDDMYFYVLGGPSLFNDISIFENGVDDLDLDALTAPGFQGTVDDFRIYGDALTETEIKELAASLLKNAGDNNGEDGNEGNTGNNQTASKVVIDWDFSDANSVKDVVLGNGVKIENGKAVFAPGNEGIALPDDIFADAETITVEMVMQPGALADYRSLLCAGNENGKWVVMALMADGSVRYAVATNGDDGSQAKGNSVSADGGATEGVVGSDITLTTNKEYTVKYVITKDVTKVYVDGNLALTVPTPEKDLIGSIGGPVNLGKATKWPDSSYEGTISSFKITLSAEADENQGGTGDNNQGNGNQNGAGDSAGDNTATGDIAIPAAIIALFTVALAGIVVLRRKKTV